MNTGGTAPDDAAAPAGVCPVIVGPTAVGKTALVTALAREYPVEIISLDSRQIYHGLRIGTAQPTAEELAVCPHHLIDFLPPEETYDAARYRRDFCRVHAEITARGGRPVVVGGAGLYLTAIREGFFDLGTEGRPLEAVRAELDALADEEIRRRLHAADPNTWQRIHANDRYRSQRALEICEVAGRPMSELAAGQHPRPALGLSFPVFVLERPVAELDARIAARTRAMLDGGWLEETRDLLTRHDADCAGLGSLGYREIVAHLAGELSAGKLEDAIVRLTRQYAKRQRTWFRKVEAASRGRPEDEAVAEAIRQSLKDDASP